jgi:antitoxin FitA
MDGMSKTIQIRDVPDDVHAALRARAASAGESLSDFLRPEIEKIARRPALSEILRRARDRTEGPTVDEIVAALHAGREEREATLEAAAFPPHDRD